MSLKKPGKREIAYTWAIYDIEKWEWVTAGPKVMQTKKVRG